MTILLTCVSALDATIFGEIQGVVDDPPHRPVAGASAKLQATTLGLRLDTGMGNDSEIAPPLEYRSRSPGLFKPNSSVAPPFTGGLICPPSAQDCEPPPGLAPVDHDQRNTLNVGFDAMLPGHVFAATNVYYGSGFSNGLPDAQYPGVYLPQHATSDISLGKSFGEGEKLQTVDNGVECSQPARAPG